jgi:hypothetical protein
MLSGRSASPLRLTPRTFFPLLTNSLTRAEPVDPVAPKTVCNSSLDIIYSPLYF